MRRTAWPFVRIHRSTAIAEAQRDPTLVEFREIALYLPFRPRVALAGLRLSEAWGEIIATLEANEREWLFVSRSINRWAFPFIRAAWRILAPPKRDEADDFLDLYPGL